MPSGIARIGNDARAAKTRFDVLHSVEHCTAQPAACGGAAQPARRNAAPLRRDECDKRNGSRLSNIPTSAMEPVSCVTSNAGRFEQVGTPPSRHHLAEALVRQPQPQPWPDDRGRKASSHPTTARSASAASGSSMKVRYCAKLNSHWRGAKRRAATTWPGRGAAPRSGRPATAARAPAAAGPTAARTPNWLGGPVWRAAGHAIDHWISRWIVHAIVTRSSPGGWGRTHRSP